MQHNSPDILDVIINMARPIKSESSTHQFVPYCHIKLATAQAPRPAPLVLYPAGQTVEVSQFSPIHPQRIRSPLQRQHQAQSDAVRVSAGSDYDQKTAHARNRHS